MLQKSGICRYAQLVQNSKSIIEDDHINRLKKNRSIIFIERVQTFDKI